MVACGSGTGSGGYDGWADLDAAVTDLESIGVSCESVPLEAMEALAGGELEGWEGPMAFCDFEIHTSFIMFPVDMDTFELKIRESAEKFPDYRHQLVFGDNWGMSCEGFEVFACEAASEFTGKPVENY